jgi:hypothetical protein
LAWAVSLATAACFAASSPVATAWVEATNCGMWFRLRHRASTPS